MNTQWERRSPRPMVYSLFAHVSAVVLLSLAFASPGVRDWAVGSVRLIVPIDIAPHFQALAPNRGGGAGGMNQPLPASQGRPPRFELVQLAPPAVTPPNPAPILAVEPTLIGDPGTPVMLDFAQLGDPLGAPGPPSSGPGSKGGIGAGGKGGIGDDGVAGLGPGGGPSGVFRVGGGVSAPKLVQRVEPEYSEEAREAKWQGVVVLQIEVWPDGRPHNLRIVQALGLGLDEKAIEAVRRWRFAPGKKDGVSVKTHATVQVSFRLL